MKEWENDPKGKICEEIVRHINKAIIHLWFAVWEIVCIFALSLIVHFKIITFIKQKEKKEIEKLKNTDDIFKTH